MTLCLWSELLGTILHATEGLDLILRLFCLIGIHLAQFCAVLWTCWDFLEFSQWLNDCIFYLYYTFHLLHFQFLQIHKCFPAILCCKFADSFHCLTFSASPHYLELRWVNCSPHPPTASCLQSHFNQPTTLLKIVQQTAHERHYIVYTYLHT